MINDAISQVFHEEFRLFAGEVLAVDERVQDAAHIERVATVVEEGLEEFGFLAASDRFRVELYAFNRHGLVANAHDVAVSSAGGHFKFRWERRFINHH